MSISTVPPSTPMSIRYPVPIRQSSRLELRTGTRMLETAQCRQRRLNDDQCNKLPRQVFLGTIRIRRAAAIARVAEVDMARFRAKLMDKFGWSAELYQQIEDRYRRFRADVTVSGKGNRADALRSMSSGTPTSWMPSHATAIVTTCSVAISTTILPFPDDPPEEGETLAAGSEVTHQLFLLELTLGPMKKFLVSVTIHPFTQHRKVRCTKRCVRRGPFPILVPMSVRESVRGSTTQWL